MISESIIFEKFSGYGSKISRKISITKSFSFGIPPDFYKENGLEQFNNVAIFYNKEEGVIGLHFNNEEGYKINKNGQGERKGASFVARSFFNAYGLDSTKYKGRYNVEKIQKDGIGDLYLVKIGQKSE